MARQGILIAYRWRAIKEVLNTDFYPLDTYTRMLTCMHISTQAHTYVHTHNTHTYYCAYDILTETLFFNAIIAKTKNQTFLL